MIPLKDLCTVEGTKTVLETKISVQDISSIKWYHNDQPLTSSERVQMVVKGAKQRLVFTRTHASDEGHYRLVVGRAETSCQLSVQSKNHCGGWVGGGGGGLGLNRVQSSWGGLVCIHPVTSFIMKYPEYRLAGGVWRCFRNHDGSVKPREMRLGQTSHRFT